MGVSEAKMSTGEIYSPHRIRHLSLPLAESLVAAGFPSPADDYIAKDLDLNEYLVANPAATFFVRVSGESMIDAGIHDGDLLVVDRSLEASSGRIVIAVIDGEMMVKRFCRLGGKVFLMAESEEYPPLEIRRETDLVIWGVVTYVVHAL